jgi:hypothetical protein
MFIYGGTYGMKHWLIFAANSRNARHLLLQHLSHASYTKYISMTKSIPLPYFSALTLPLRLTELKIRALGGRSS